MDAHDVSRGRPSLAAALQNIQARTLVIAIQSDILFPVEESRFLATHIPNATFHLIDSTYGHDGFLLEFEQIGTAIKIFLQGAQQPSQMREPAA
jgi:homoserine O-acetyltransferase